MDPLHRLFSGQSLGNKRWWLVAGAVVIVMGIVRPLLCNSQQMQPLGSSTPATTPAAQSQAAPIEGKQVPLLLEPEPKAQPLLFPSDSSSGSPLWRMLGSLAVVIVLIVAGWIVFRRHMGGRMGSPPRRQVTLLESTRVGPRQSMLLVQAGSRKYLLAATAERITLVADVTEACAKNDPPSA